MGRHYIASSYHDDDGKEDFLIGVKQHNDIFTKKPADQYVISFPDSYVTLNKKQLKKLYHAIDEEVFDESDTWKAKDEALSEARNKIAELEETLRIRDEEIEELKARR